MIPRQYAKKLFNKMFYINGINPQNTLTKGTAKKCALAIVNEIIDFNCYMMPEVKEPILDYYKEVRKEIELL